VEITTCTTAVTTTLLSFMNIIKERMTLYSMEENFGKFATFLDLASKKNIATFLK
jgi:hypothetical protein